jgi:hypothetical protein
MKSNLSLPLAIFQAQLYCSKEVVRVQTDKFYSGFSLFERCFVRCVFIPTLINASTASLLALKQNLLERYLCRPVMIHKQRTNYLAESKLRYDLLPIRVGVGPLLRLITRYKSKYISAKPKGKGT